MSKYVNKTPFNYSNTSRANLKLSIKYVKHFVVILCDKNDMS